MVDNLNTMNFPLCTDNRQLMSSHGSFRICNSHEVFPRDYVL